MLAGGAHFYNTYACADGKFVSVGAIEPQFYALLLKLCDIHDAAFYSQMDREQWPVLKTKIAAIFATKPRQAWCELMEGTDVCFAPVLDMNEALEHVHNRRRGTFIEVDGVMQPGPAPRFSRTVPEVSGPPASPGQDNEAILRDWDVPGEMIERLREKGVI
jgi:alpha-methylacyl-CoA racemase